MTDAYLIPQPTRLVTQIEAERTCLAKFGASNFLCSINVSYIAVNIFLSFQAGIAEAIASFIDRNTPNKLDMFLFDMST